MKNYENNRILRNFGLRGFRGLSVEALRVAFAAKRWQEVYAGENPEYLYFRNLDAHEVMVPLREGRAVQLIAIN